MFSHFNQSFRWLINLMKQDKHMEPNTYTTKEVLFFKSIKFAKLRGFFTHVSVSKHLSDPITSRLKHFHYKGLSGQIFSPGCPALTPSPIHFSTSAAKQRGQMRHTTPQKSGQILEFHSDKINLESLRCWINKQYAEAWWRSGAPRLSDVSDCSFYPLIKRRLKFTLNRKNSPNPWKMIS